MFKKKNKVIGTIGTLNTLERFRKFLRGEVSEEDFSTKQEGYTCTPIITPKIAKELAKEGYELRKEFHKRILEMWKRPDK